MLNRKSFLKLVIILILLAAVIATAIVLNNKDNEQTANKEQTNQNQPSVLTPDQVSDKISSYLGKDLSVKGTIIQIKPSEYYVMDQTQDSPAAILLDFSKTDLKPSDYADIPAQRTAQGGEGEEPKSKGVFIISGKLVEGKIGSSPRLVVESITR